jgi:DNA-binding XRE family transcriptional regulator
LTEAPVKPESPRRPGRRPQHETRSYRLADRYLSRLKEALRASRRESLDVTKNNFARALGISRDTLNSFEREVKVKDTIKKEILIELTIGPTQAVIDYFIAKEQSHG